MAEIDSLEIKIGAEMRSASASIELLNKKLNTLATSLSQINNSSLKGVSDFAKTAENISKSISNISTEKLSAFSAKLSEASSAMNRFAQSSQKINDTIKNLDFSQSIKGVKEFENLFKSQLDSTVSDFGIKGKEAIGKVSAEIKQLSQAVSSFITKKSDSSGIEKSMQNLADIIKNNMNILDESKKSYADLIEYINKTNVSGQKVYLPFNPSEFVNDYTSMRATLGKAFTSDASAKNVQDLDSYVRELNSTLGTNIQIENNAADTFRNLVDAVKQGKDAFMDYNQAVNAGVINEDDLWKQIWRITSAFEKYSQELRKAGGELQETPLSRFAESMASLRDIKSPNVQWIKTLSEGLEKLKNIDTNKLKEAADNLRNFEGIDAKSFNGVASVIKKISEVEVGNLPVVGNALKSFAEGASTLSSVRFESQNIKDLINSITRLSNANTGSLANIDFTKLGNSIKELTETLSGAEKVQQNTISMTNAIAKLANAGGNADVVKTALPDLGTKLKEFFQTMSGASKVETDTITFAQAIGNLANAGNRASITAKNLDDLKDKTLSFINALAGAQNVDAGVVQLINSLANLANSGNGANNFLNSFRNSGNKTSASVGKLKSSIDSLSKSMNGLKGSISGTFGGIKNFTKQILAANGIMLGLYGTVRGIKSAMNLSSDLTEVQNVVNVTFGNMIYKVEEFAETSIEKFGMSELALKQYSSRFQAMGTAMGINSGLIKSANSFLEQQTDGYIEASSSLSDMSLNLTKLTADMASFYNVEQDVVAEKLASVFTGQTRPLRDFGLDLTQATLQEWALKQGIDADIQSMSQAEKTMLRYQYVLANTTAAHNDFSKTANTWANQVRILKQNFEQLGSIVGGSLINAFKPFVQALNVVLKQVISFAKIVTEALGAIFGWKYEVSSGGMVSDWGDIEDSTEGVAGNLGDAAKSVKEMNKAIRAWDELNLLTTNEPSKGTGGSGGAGGAGLDSDADGSFGKLVPTDTILKDYESFIDNLYDLGSYISKALEDTLEKIDWDKIYSKAEGFGSGLSSFLNGLIRPGLFDELGNTISGAINTALHFLDSFGGKFDWGNFGSSLSSGLVSFLRGIDWETALSAASNWGKGIGTALNSFISEEAFGEVGNAVAMALNTAIQFALDLGQTFDFKNLGNSIAAGVNKFFKKFDTKKLAQAINVWIKGALKTVSTLLKKTDFEMIGKKIGTFLSELDILGMMGRFAQMLWEAIKAGFSLLGGLIQEAPLETALIAAFAVFKFLKVGSIIASGISSALVSSLATRLGVTLAADSSISNVLSTALSAKLIAPLQNLLNKIAVPLQNLSSKIALIAPALGVALGGFVELNVVSESIENLVTGTGNFILEIGKIAGAVALAGKAMTAILGFPAGVVAAAIAGIIGAIKGINDAFEEIDAENIGIAINDALTRPGGTDIDEIFSSFTDNMDKIKDSFSQISEKSTELDGAKRNIQDTVFEIDKIKTSLDAGVMTAEEAIPKLNNLYGQLADAIITKIGAAGDVLLATFAEGSISAEAFENAGVNAEEMRQQVVASMDEQEKAIYDMRIELEELRNTDPTNPKISELEAQMLSMASGIGEADKAVEELQTKTQIGINWEKYLNEDGLDIGGIRSALDEYKSSVISTRETAEDEFNKAIIAAKELGDEENYNEVRTALPGAMEYMNKLTAEEALKLANTLQEDAIGGINKVVEEAQANWEEMNWFEKLFHGFNKRGYISDYVNQFKENTIDPLSGELEIMMNELGVTGAGWSSDAMETIISGMWEYDTTTSEYKVSENFSGVISNAIKNSEKSLEGTTKDFGNNVVLGITKGIEEGDTESIGNKMLDMVSFAKSIMGIHSPSTVMAEIGGYMMEGLSIGIDDMIESVMQKFTDIKDKIVESWNEAKQSTEEVWNTISGKVSETWGNIKTWAGEKFNAAKESIGTAWDNIREKTSTVWGEVSNKISKTWDDMKGWASEKFGNIKESITDSWNDINESTGRIWNEIKNAVKTPINGIIGFVNGMLDGITSGVNGVIRALNKLDFDIPDWVPVLGGKSFGFNLSTITAPHIPELANGAVFKGGDPFLAVVNDQPHGQTNIEAPLDTIRQAFREEVYAGYTNNFDSDNNGVSELLSETIRQNRLLEEQNQLLNAILKKPNLSNNDIFKATQKEWTREAGRTQRNPVPIY